jgi:hypothetical protein
VADEQTLIRERYHERYQLNNPEAFTKQNYLPEHWYSQLIVRTIEFMEQNCTLAMAVR